MHHHSHGHAHGHSYVREHDRENDGALFVTPLIACPLHTEIINRILENTILVKKTCSLKSAQQHNNKFPSAFKCVIKY